MAVDPLFVQGVLKITNVFLSIVAAVLILWLFRVGKGDKRMKPWYFLFVALAIFAFGETMGTLDAFGFLYFRPFLPGIEVGVIVFFIIALIYRLKMKPEKKISEL